MSYLLIITDAFQLHDEPLVQNVCVRVIGESDSLIGCTIDSLIGCIKFCFLYTSPTSSIIGILMKITYEN